MASMDWVDDLKVVELRKRLKEHGENTSGKKAVLVDRLKAVLAKEDEPAEADMEVDEPDEEKPETAIDAAKVEEVEEKETKTEKKEVKGGLTELLGDGKDDLEFDFEAEKPTRKKQKLGDTPARHEKKQRTEKTPPEATAAPEKKSAAQEDLIDFETPRAGEMKEAPNGEGQGNSVGKTGSVSEGMEMETPVVAEEDRTCALRIQNFVRPFTEKAAKEMLSGYGAVEDMWMPPIKTHCYVLYETPAQAHEAYLGTFRVVWPRSGKPLLPQFVAVEEAKKAIEDGRSRGAFARASGSASFQKPHAAPFPPPNRPTVTNEAPMRPVAKPALSLEDLFFKTQAKPPIYYLPLTDEQVAEKKQLEQERATEAAQPTEESAKDTT